MKSQAKSKPRSRGCAVVLFALSLGVGSGAPAAGQEWVAATDQVQLSPGDLVQITVFRQPELSGEFTIGSDGSVDHPLYQSVVVAGVPLETARGRLRSYLLEWESDPQVFVKPLFRVGVGGEVMQPSLYTFPPEVTIAQAVAAAGGVTEAGRLDAVRVLRDDQVFFVDLTASGGEGLRMTVRSGDQIIVRRSRSEFFRDYVAPAGTLLMAAVTLVSVLTR